VLKYHFIPTTTAGKEAFKKNVGQTEERITDRHEAIAYSNMFNFI